VRRAEDAHIRLRPPFGAETGPERAPPPRPPRYEEIRKSVIPREQATVGTRPPTRERPVVRREATPAPRPAPPASVQAPRTRSRDEKARGEAGRDEKGRSLPGQPASQTYRGRDRENRDAR